MRFWIRYLFLAQMEESNLTKKIEVFDVTQCVEVKPKMLVIN